MFRAVVLVCFFLSDGLELFDFHVVPVSRQPFLQPLRYRQGISGQRMDDDPDFHSLSHFAVI